MPYKWNKIFFPGEVQLKKLQKGNLLKIQASTGFEPEFPEIGRVPPPTELQKKKGGSEQTFIVPIACIASTKLIILAQNLPFAQTLFSSYKL